MQQKNIAIFLVVVVLAALVAVGFWYWRQQKAAQQEQETKTEEPPQSLGEEIFEQTQNPAEVIKEELPETNPFQKAKNPFKNVYKNPFE